MNSFLRDLVEELKDEDTSLLEDGKTSAQFTSCIDTGCYMLNAAFSGSIFGGMADNKILGLAGESSTGKSFFALSIVKSFLEKYPNSGVIYYDTEAAITKEMMTSRGIDPSRVIVSEPETLQKFRTHALKLIEAYIQKPEKSRPKLMFVLDSLGMLSSTKEMEDSLEGKETRDMTKAQLIRAVFRTITLKLAKARIPMIVTAHTYQSVGAYVPTSVVSGGGGLKYAASTIAMLSKSKDRDGTDVVGNIITVKMEKSRLSKENSVVKLKLSYATGLDKYYGLLDLAEKAGIFKKVSTRYELPDGRKVFGKAINDNPEEYFTQEILLKLDEAAKKYYDYGGEENNNWSDDEELRNDNSEQSDNE